MSITSFFLFSERQREILTIAWKGWHKSTYFMSHIYYLNWVLIIELKGMLNEFLCSHLVQNRTMPKLPCAWHKSSILRKEKDDVVCNATNGFRRLSSGFFIFNSKNTREWKQAVSVLKIRLRIIHSQRQNDKGSREIVN